MVKIEQELSPFTISNFVRVKTKPRLRQEGFKESPALPLSEVPTETLEAMCDEFRLAVLTKAAKNES